MNSQTFYRSEQQRRLFIKKDLIELSHWMSDLEYVNEEIVALKIIGERLLQRHEISVMVLALRRNNTLVMARLCKYDQELKTELEYGKIDYDLERAKYHERIRLTFQELIAEFKKLKHLIYQRLTRYEPN